MTLTLATAVTATDTAVKVAYAKPTSGSANKLRDRFGNETATFPDQAVTNNTTTTTETPANWSLKPTALNTGDQFRLIFLSSTKRNADVTTISTYNTFVQNRAAAGHTAIRAYSAGFRVVGCTADVDARDNTSTTFTTEDKGVPIYWLNGAKVADEYEDFYDGDWDDEVNDKDESGTNGLDISLNVNSPFTGCAHNGTEALDGSISQGFAAVGGTKIGRPNSTGSGHGPPQQQRRRDNHQHPPYVRALGGLPSRRAHQHPRHRRTDHQRHGSGRPDPHGLHGRHLRHRWTAQRVHLPVETR